MPDPLPSLAEIDFRQSYYTFLQENRSYASTSNQRRGFFTQLAKQTNQPEMISAQTVKWCGRCLYPGHASSMRRADGRHDICAQCAVYYASCSNCSTLTRSGNMYGILGGAQACYRCVTTQFSYCNRCAGYYSRSDREDHEHAQGSNCCQSEFREFEIRNGGSRLANDTRLSVSLPAGEITDVGLDAIRMHIYYLADYAEGYVMQRKWIALSEQVATLGSKWQTKDGNFAKRLSKLAYKNHELKLSPKTMTFVGTTARNHSTGVDFDIEITRELNLPASRFGHAESCWWQSYSNSRCAFKTNGGFGIRTFSGAGDRAVDVSGRAWVIPLKKNDQDQFRPTYETVDPAAFLVFNGYSALTGYTPARILAQLTGSTYRKVRFDCDPMYVNSGAGYLVGSEEVVDGFTDGRIYFELDQHSNLHLEENRTLVNA